MAEVPPKGDAPAPDAPAAAEGPPPIAAELPDTLPETVGADLAPPAPSSPARGVGLDTDPYFRDSILAREAFDRAVREESEGDEEDAVLSFMRASKLAEGAREWYLTAVASHKVGDLLLTPAPPYDLEHAFRMHRRAIAAYEACGHYAEARRLSFRLNCLKMRRGRELGLSRRTRAELFLFWAVAGFGYRPLRVIGLAFWVVVLYGVVYHATGGVVRNGPGAGPVGFLDAVYFSGVTFATVGYGDFLPAPFARPLALTEGAIGAFAMSFFVVVLANRLRH